MRAFTVGSLRIAVAMFEPPEASLNMARDVTKLSEEAKCLQLAGGIHCARRL